MDVVAEDLPFLHDAVLKTSFPLASVKGSHFIRTEDNLGYSDDSTYKFPINSLDSEGNAGSGSYHASAASSQSPLQSQQSRSQSPHGKSPSRGNKVGVIEIPSTPTGLGTGSNKKLGTEDFLHMKSPKHIATELNMGSLIGK
jgi:hypothetical protein